MKPSLLNDVLFKIVFGAERSEFVLRPLLNALLGLTGPQRILHLNVTNPTLPKSYLKDKGVILWHSSPCAKPTPETTSAT